MALAPTPMWDSSRPSPEDRHGRATALEFGPEAGWRSAAGAPSFGSGPGRDRVGPERLAGAILVAGGVALLSL
jgi:hypothetical protein